MSQVFISGATGATGRLLVRQLLEAGYPVTAMVRSRVKAEHILPKHPNLRLVEGTVLDMPDQELDDLIRSCSWLVSCLGHNATLKGIWGHPRKLVTQSVEKLCQSIERVAASDAVSRKFILMGSNGVLNPVQNEKYTFADSVVVSAVRLAVPPHADNEQAAWYLLNTRAIEWVVVRPDALVDAPEVSAYKSFATHQKGVIFNSGKTSRINVAGFIKELISQPEIWQQWTGKMPVLYNANSLN